MKICTLCGQEIPQPVGRLICSQCNRPIVRGSGGWTHGPDGRPRHRNCESACVPEAKQGTMDLLENPAQTPTSNQSQETL